uniref:Putative secreted protein n=1 Tax=Anopheles triannulatus TaxID=58253 RepID=A0A2M4B3C5_9DIPT
MVTQFSFSTLLPVRTSAKVASDWWVGNNRVSARCVSSHVMVCQACQASKGWRDVATRQHTMPCQHVEEEAEKLATKGRVRVRRGPIRCTHSVAYFARK